MEALKFNTLYKIIYFSGQRSWLEFLVKEAGVIDQELKSLFWSQKIC